MQPYSASALSRAIKTPKIYFRDTGLACYLTRWLTADALKNSAVAGNMFETFVVSDILKTYSNEGKDYRFNSFYYRGKDKKVSNENEIDELPPHTRDFSRELGGFTCTIKVRMV